MPCPFVAFIRHGQYHQLDDTPSAHQPFPLSDTGRQAAQHGIALLLQMIDRFDLSVAPVVDSSSLLRAWQTAELFKTGLRASGHAALEIDSFDGLAERGLGSAANLTVSQIEEVLRQDPRFNKPPADWKSNSEYRLPLLGAESHLEAGRRVAAHLERRATEMLEYPNANRRLKLIVGHGASFRHAAFHLGLLTFQQVRELTVEYATPILFEYCGDKGWRHAAGDWKRRPQANQAAN